MRGKPSEARKRILAYTPDPNQIRIELLPHVDMWMRGVRYGYRVGTYPDSTDIAMLTDRNTYIRLKQGDYKLVLF